MVLYTEVTELIFRTPRQDMDFFTKSLQLAVTNTSIHLQRQRIQTALKAI